MDQQRFVGHMAGVGVVQQDKLAVGCATDVKFDSIDRQFKRSFDAFQRVFERETRSPTVTNNFHGELLIVYNKTEEKQE
jgi:hypothetical protein